MSIKYKKQYRKKEKENITEEKKAIKKQEYEEITFDNF